MRISRNLSKRIYGFLTQDAINIRLVKRSFSSSKMTVLALLWEITKSVVIRKGNMETLVNAIMETIIEVFCILGLKNNLLSIGQNSHTTWKV